MRLAAFGLIPLALFAVVTAAASWIFLQVVTFSPPLAYAPDLALRYLPYALSNGTVRLGLAVSFGLPLAAAALAAFQFGAMRLIDPKRPLHGRSRFATVRDGQRSGLVYSREPRSDALVIGSTRVLGLFRRYVSLPGVEHLILYAKTGAGKGVSLVIPNCLIYRDSLVVLDVKQEAFAATAGHRQRMGQDVFLFSPLAEGGRTHCWNPLGDITCEEPGYISKLQRRAFEIFPETTGRERFWQDGARSAFLGICVLIAETPGMALTPASAFRFFTRGDGAEELARLVKERRDAGNPYSQVCVDLISDYLNGTEEVVKGMRKHVTATMGLWFNPQVAAATARSDFDLRDLRRKKMTVYVGVMPSDIMQLGALLRLFFTQLFEANTDVTPEQDATVRHRCHVLLDEFTALPPMRAFAKAAGFARGFGLHFSYVVQSKNQVREEYRGAGEASLLENVGVEIVFGTNDPVLCKEASERAGYDTVQAETRTAPRFFAFFRAKQHSTTEHMHRRALLLPQEVAQLPATKELVFRASNPPFLLDRLCWYKDENFARLKRPPPAIEPVTYGVPRDDGKVTLPDAPSKEERRKGKKAA